MEIITNNAAPVSANNITERKPMIDKLGRSYGTGRRKTSVARVWIKRGTGKITVNKRDVTKYFVRTTHLMLIREPFVVVKQAEQFDVICTVHGGGASGQAGALRHGISRALDNYDPDTWHVILSKSKLLTRDSRMVESKKYGRHKARRSPQFSKR